MTYTDTQLKQALAKMLPAIVEITPSGDLRWPSGDGSGSWGEQSSTPNSCTFAGWLRRNLTQKNS